MSDLESRLEALRQEYAAGLPAAIAEASEAFGRVPSDGQEAIEAVWQVAHRTYGTAGSYGLDEVAETARALEALLTPHRNDDALPTEVADSASEALETLAAQASAAAART